MDISPTFDAFLKSFELSEQILDFFYQLYKNKKKNKKFNYKLLILQGLHLNTRYCSVQFVLCRETGIIQVQNLRRNPICSCLWHLWFLRKVSSSWVLNVNGRNCFLGPVSIWFVKWKEKQWRHLLAVLPLIYFMDCKTAAGGFSL